MIIIDLIYNLSVLVALSVISGFIGNRFDKYSLKGRVFQGLLFGLVAIVGMLNPFVLTEGIIFDGRSIVISLCTLFFGPVSGLISSIATILFRVFYIGGGGALMGSLVTTASFGIGLYFYYIKGKNKIKLTKLNLYIFGLIVNGVMMILVFTLPGKYIRETYQVITITVLGIYPLITILIGKVLSDQDDLIERERVFKTLIGNLPGFAYRCLNDKNWTMTYISEQCEEITGYTPEEFLYNKSLAFNEIIKEEYKKTLWDKWQNLLPNKKIFEHEYPIITKSGEEKWVWERGKGIYSDDNKVLYLEGFILDITKIKKDDIIQQMQYSIANAVVNSKSLRELLPVVKTELSKLIDTNNFFIAAYDNKTDTLRQLIWVDEKDEYSEWKAENSLSGYVVKNGVTLLIKKTELKEFAKSKKLNLYGTPSECWLGVPLKIGEKVLGAIVVQSYNDANAYDKSSADLLEIIANQISIYIEKKKADEELIIAKEKAEESDNLKTAFLQNMSHEIRTPLNSILGFSQLLNEDSMTMEEVKTYSGFIQSGGKRLLKLIDNIIDISKIESGKIKLDYSVFNVSGLVEEVLSQFILTAQLQKIKLIHTNLTGHNELNVESDSSKLHQVLTNLINNALKFTTKGFVEVKYEITGNEIVFCVNDTGKGIRQQHIGKIFERFYQADMSLSRGHEGTGLGLAICKGLVESMSGKIWVESELEKGTSFYFALPYKPVTKNSAEKPRGDIKPITDKLILVAEDDDSSFKFIETLLNKTGVKILRAINGIEALEICKSRNDISLILMDIKMPKMNGIDATKEIKKLFPQIPIIAQTAYAFSSEKELVLEAGCDDYITKPIQKEELIECINKY